MLFPQRMKKLDVVIIKKYVDDVAKEIVDFGDFEVLEVAGYKAESYALKKEPFEEMSARLFDFKRRLNAINLFYDVTLKSEEIKSKAFMDEFSIKNTLKELETEIAAYNREMENLKKRQHDIKIKLNSIRFFGNLDMDFSDTQSIQHFYMGFGSVPSSHYRAFMDAISLLPSVVMNVGMVEGSNMVFYTVPKSAREQLDKILQSVHYKDYGVPTDMKGSIKSNIVRYGFEMTMTYDEEIWLEEKYAKMKKKFAEIAEKLLASIDYHIAMSRLKGEMAGTNSVYLFSGWVPADDMPKLKEKIERITDQRCLFLDEDAAQVVARDGVKPPTRLQNPKVLQPFEMLVSLFGTPGYREFDPTIFAAILYVIMYGAMFGDIGHGLVLSGLGLATLIFKKFRKIWKFGLLMFWIGLSSALFGLLYGSVFGNEHLVSALWMHPIENIMTILMIAIGFGVAVVSLGIILSIINSILRKEWGRLLFSATGIAGLMFYWGVLGLGYCLISKISFSPVLYLIPGIAALLIWSEKTLERVLFKHGEKTSWGMGFFEVFEAVLSFMSNTISFLRVGAFALNHGALMSAVFILAGLAKGAAGRWMILLIGNILVIVLEGLIVGIQALRLEFYEFFIKFFRADGKPFEALDIYKKD